MKSIALGWPDETFPANAVVSERKSVAEATVFVGFESTRKPLGAKCASLSRPFQVAHTVSAILNGSGAEKSLS
jgi:hypothetical protein